MRGTEGLHFIDGWHDLHKGNTKVQQQGSELSKHKTHVLNEPLTFKMQTQKDHAFLRTQPVLFITNIPFVMLCYGEQSTTSVQNKCVIFKSNDAKRNSNQSTAN